MYGTNKENISREVIALLLKMARHDGHFDEKEFVFILQVGYALNVSPDEMREIQMNLDSFSFQPPKDESERMTILYYLLFCMKSDGKIRQKEIEMITRIAFKLGFRQDLTNDLIIAVKNYGRKKLPPDLLLENIKTYMN
jgi:uncharacterized tellurite resistance protein B-like protein